MQLSCFQNELSLFKDHIGSTASLVYILVVIFIGSNLLEALLWYTSASLFKKENSICIQAELQAVAKCSCL